MNVDLLERVKSVLIEELDVKHEELTPEATLMGDLGADSLDLVHLALEVEERFGITMPERDLPGLKTVRDVVEYLDARTQSV